MVIESVGYRGEPIFEEENFEGNEASVVGGVPYDKARARVMNLEGRVTDGSGVMVSIGFFSSYISLCYEIVLSLRSGYLVMPFTDPRNVYRRLDRERSNRGHRIDHATGVRGSVDDPDGSLSIRPARFVFHLMPRASVGGHAGFCERVDQEGGRIGGLEADRRGRGGTRQRGGKAEGKVCLDRGDVEGAGLRRRVDERHISSRCSFTI